LEQAERQVSEGKRHVLGQAELIARLEPEGHDTTQALEFLHQFEQLQEMHVADRDRLQKERDELA
jgi:hypothetical protein